MSDDNRRCPLHNKLMTRERVESKGGYRFMCPVKDCSVVLFIADRYYRDRGVVNEKGDRN